MMPANTYTSKKFTRMCFEKSEVTSAGKKMVVSKNLTHFCYPIAELVAKIVSHSRNGIAEVSEVLAHNHFFSC